ncbi:MAG: DUF616 domain-containing protein [Chitinophagaceae bacterium]|nr:DUF616 domain-containing protein [Chitinophagaceae bacterium]
MNICYTAIIGNYDTLKEPQVITPGWRYICFTDQDFKSNVWEICGVSENASVNPQASARFLKLNPHIVLGDHTRSMWADGSFIINCNLNHWFDNNCKPPMTCIRHPIRRCVYQEADAVKRNRRTGTEGVVSQMTRYKEEGLPEYNGLIQSGLLMRWNTKEVNDFCEFWWKETMAGSMRDQISFAYCHWKMPVANFINYDYRKIGQFIYKKHNA